MVYQQMKCQVFAARSGVKVWPLSGSDGVTKELVHLERNSNTLKRSLEEGKVNTVIGGGSPRDPGTGRIAVDINIVETPRILPPLAPRMRDSNIQHVEARVFVDKIFAMNVHKTELMKNNHVGTLILQRESGHCLTHSQMHWLTPLEADEKDALTHGLVETGRNSFEPHVSSERV